MGNDFNSDVMYILFCFVRVVNKVVGLLFILLVIIFLIKFGNGFVMLYFLLILFIFFI